MTDIDFIAIGINALIWGVGFLLLVYLIFKRIKDKKNEDFEQRDN